MTNSRFWTTASLWILWQWSVQWHAMAAESCVFAVGQMEYNLCPILQHATPADAMKVVIETETPPTHTSIVYDVGLGMSLKRDGTLPEALQCPEGTWICLTVVNTRPAHPSEPSRILQVVPVAGNPGIEPKAKLLPKSTEEDEHAPLQITLHGGRYMNKTQKASFQFLCDPSVESSTPKYLWNWNGTHTFSWTTQHACPKALSDVPPPSDSDPDLDPPSAPPEDPELDGDTPIPKSPSRLLPLAFWICLPLLLIIRLSYPWLSRHRPNRLYISPKSQRAHFRPSEARLMQWAEDPEFGEGALLHYHWRQYDSEDEEGEELALTPNPRGTFGDGKGGRYGSVQNSEGG